MSFKPIGEAAARIVAKLRAAISGQQRTFHENRPRMPDDPGTDEKFICDKPSHEMRRYHHE
jgi:hypothetical protein